MVLDVSRLVLGGYKWLWLVCCFSNYPVSMSELKGG